MRGYIIENGGRRGMMEKKRNDGEEGGEREKKMEEGGEGGGIWVLRGGRGLGRERGGEVVGSGDWGLIGRVNYIYKGKRYPTPREKKKQEQKNRSFQNFIFSF